MSIYYWEIVTVLCALIILASLFGLLLFVLPKNVFFLTSQLLSLRHLYCFIEWLTLLLKGQNSLIMMEHYLSICLSIDLSIYVSSIYPFLYSSDKWYMWVI